MYSLNKDFLHQVLSVQSVTRAQGRMQEFICNFVIQCIDNGIIIDLDTDQVGNIYLTRGSGDSGYPCVVAHMDTVHKIIPDNQFTIMRNSNRWFGFNPIHMEMTGIGGDDKVGVFVALEALRHFENIKVAFFVDEEMGAIGSGQADMAWFDDCNLVLQADRRGNGDFVSEIGTDLFDEEFLEAVQPYLTRFGYRECKFGGITDVGELKENGLAVACANLSAGYYNPHMDNEYIVLPDVEKVLNLIFTLVEDLGSTRWDHIASKSSRWGYRSGWNNDYDWSNYRVPSGVVHYITPANQPTTLTPEEEEAFVNITKSASNVDCHLCQGPTDFDDAEYAYYCHTCGTYTYTEHWGVDDKDVDRWIEEQKAYYEQTQKPKSNTKTYNRKQKRQQSRALAVIC